MTAEAVGINTFDSVFPTRDRLASRSPTIRAIPEARQPVNIGGGLQRESRQLRAVRVTRTSVPCEMAVIVNTWPPTASLLNGTISTNLR